MYRNKTIAVFGVSVDPAKYGYKIFTVLLKKGFRVYGINPKGGEVAGQPVFARLADVPARADVAIMVIPPAALVPAVQQCIDAGVKEIWFQPGAQSDDAYDLAETAGIMAVNSCFMADNGLW